MFKWKNNEPKSIGIWLNPIAKAQCFLVEIAMWNNGASLVVTNDASIASYSFFGFLHFVKAKEGNQLLFPFFCFLQSSKNQRMNMKQLMHY